MRRKDCCCQPARYCALHSKHARAIAKAEKAVDDNGDQALPARGLSRVGRLAPDP